MNDAHVTHSDFFCNGQHVDELRAKLVSDVVEKTSTRRRSRIPCVVVEKNTTRRREGVGVVVEKNE